ncbi:MAG: PAS domain S-box protein [Candidatus Omnitrophica bacterium]|nr:PAS domain S-box protein [Candidatus Omnitrophota bacterium]
MSGGLLPLRTKFILLIFGLVVVLGIGAVDYLTGTEVSLAIFYVFPIALVTWWIGFLGGFTTALAAMAVWLGAELLGGQRFGLGIEYWNGIVRLAFFLIVVVSLSLRRRSDAALRQAEGRLKALFQFAPDPIILVNGSGMIIQANERATNAFGYAERELIGMDAEELLAARCRSSHLGGSRYIGHPKLHQVTIGEPHARHKDGSEFPVEIVLSPLEMSGEQEIIAVIRNATARRLGETEHAHLAAIIDASEDAIISTSLDGTILSWNRGAERLYGYSAKEAVGRSISLIVPDAQQDEERTLLERIRRGEQSEHYQTARKSKSGELIQVSLAASPLKEANGKLFGVSVITRKSDGYPPPNNVPPSS